jgi:hypothetical protein
MPSFDCISKIADSGYTGSVHSITDNTNGKTYYFTDIGEVWKFQREQDTARWTKCSSVIGSDEVEEIVEPDELEEINISSIANKDDWLTF